MVCKLLQHEEHIEEKDALLYANKTSLLDTLDEVMSKTITSF